MSSFEFSHAPGTRYRVTPQADGVLVDDARLAVRGAGPGSFVAVVDGRPETLQAVAHGDAVYVQLRGRAWRLQRVDPARGSGTGAVGAAGAAGACLASMPGVVVSLHARLGQRVAQGEALLVIESMKLQMTIAALADGVLTELPVAVGQTFQRGALLARTEVGGRAA